MKNIITRIRNNSAFLYAAVGVVNTLVGYGIMYGLTFLGVIPEIANAIGYIVGFLNSYILNKKITFKSTNTHSQDFIRFAVAMIIAYGVNMIVLIITYRICGISEYIAFIISGIAYTLVGYLVSKFWAFSKKNT